MKQYTQSYVCVAKYGAQPEKKKKKIPPPPVLDVFLVVPLITSAEAIHLP